jgi:hypothetical protein
MPLKKVYFQTLFIEKLIELSVQKDETPFFINATAGTTVLVS